MATNQKTKKRKTADASKLNPDKMEKIEVKKIIHDERSHKIAGTILILISFLLFIAFTSYLFTWQQDQSKVRIGAKILLPSHDQQMANSLGTAGAYFSDIFFRSGFGVASYLFCLFFFVVGVNLFAPRKIFSVSRNIRYVVAGLLVISVCASFLMHTPHPHYLSNSSPEFFWGGKVGDMINEWLQQVIGYVGTAALLLVCLLSYIIWRFNPSFNFSRKKVLTEDIFPSSDDHKVFEEEGLKTRSDILPLSPGSSKEEPLYDHEFEVVEKNEIPVVRNQSIKDEKIISNKAVAGNGLTLEVKNADSNDEKSPEIVPVTARQKMEQDPYDPILDLRNYKYPTVDLLDTHGSERIVQDASELEDNKNQIINTLKNYDIEIQKIFATVGPTVTLYEIIPAPGVRISRIKNLEDDIALSLSALGIRIIAPIPGKGTIGIEVPNLKKSVVSMKTLLSSDKFLNNNFLLPIAIGKKINNENFIVDLATMPHLLMAGATGQGKSVGLNAILISLLYKKHPSQLKLVLIDPKKVELSIYKTIEKHFLAKLQIKS